MKRATSEAVGWMGGGEAEDDVGELNVMEISFPLKVPAFSKRICRRVRKKQT